MIWRMNMWKFSSWKGKGKDKWLFLLTIGVILCILAFPAETLTKNKKEVPETMPDESDMAAATDAVPAAAKVTDSYEAELEHRVREILKTVDGVGEVDVMIILKSSSEKVLHVDNSSSFSLTEETDANGGSRKVQSEELDSSTVLVSGDNRSEPVIEKEIRPELSGIIISAAGGGNPKVCAEISAAMEALFDLPAHKIKVLKRVE
ncbi:MAG: stage III sporulation protein AG [Lachnospiraceae bacterium]